jgi:hypothetical protein
VLSGGSLFRGEQIARYLIDRYGRITAAMTDNDAGGDEAMIKEEKAEGGQLIFLVPRSSTQPSTLNRAADTASPRTDGRMDRVSHYTDHESWRARIDSFLSGELALLLSILFVVVLGGLAAYYFGP